MRNEIGKGWGSTMMSGTLREANARGGRQAIIHAVEASENTGGGSYAMKNERGASEGKCSMNLSTQRLQLACRGGGLQGRTIEHFLTVIPRDNAFMKVATSQDGSSDPFMGGKRMYERAKYEERMGRRGVVMKIH